MVGALQGVALTIRCSTASALVGTASGKYAGEKTPFSNLKIVGAQGRYVVTATAEEAEPLFLAGAVSGLVAVDVVQCSLTETFDVSTNTCVPAPPAALCRVVSFYE